MPRVRGDGVFVGLQEFWEGAVEAWAGYAGGELGLFEEL